MSRADYAKAYAATLAPPFALKPNGKSPLKTGWQSETLPGALASLAAHPGANLGVRIPPGVFVFDIDADKGGFESLAALESVHGELPKTLTAKTRGGGRHFWFRIPEGATVRQSVATLGAGLDTRAHGKGLVAVAPSTVDGKGYSWPGWDPLSGEIPQIAACPDWLLSMVTTKPRKEATDSPATLAPVAGEATAPPGAQTITDGSRNTTLTSMAGSMRRAGFDEPAIKAALLVENEKCSPPLSKADIGIIAKSVARYDPSPERTAQAGFAIPEAITTTEWNTARSTPRCIVQDYLYADVGLNIGPGGISKTTLKQFEAVHIVLGRPLYGLAIRAPGPVVIITSEDSREMLIARLREVCQGMHLSAAELAIVMQRVRISDVSGSGFKLTEVRGDVVRPSEGVDLIIEACQTIKPVLIVIDPAVSFGVGESRVNDAEQGLVEAARKLRSALDCCIQYIHHSGKANAREKAVDQYAGRGGSAFADGCRMVHVLQSLTAAEWCQETGTELLPGEYGLRLARPKMSYCPPQGDILIRRVGYRFEHVHAVATSGAEKIACAANQIWDLLILELSQGRYHSRNTLESLATGLKRGELRGALDWLQASGRIEEREVPNLSKGGKRTYLHPVASPSQNGEPIKKTAENEDCFADSKIVFASPPPLGKKTAAKLPPFVFPPLPYGSPDIDGEPMANPANQSEYEFSELI